MSRYFPDPEAAPLLCPLSGLETRVLTGLTGERMMMVLSATQPGHTVDIHTHPHEQIGIVHAGQAVLRIGGEERRVRPGDFYCIPAGVPHGDTCLGDRPFVMLDVFCPPREEFGARPGISGGSDVPAGGARTMTNETLNSYALSRNELKAAVTDLHDAQMVYQPVGVPNHPAWLLGHLALSCELMGIEVGLPPWLPDFWATRFGPGSRPVPARDAYPDKDALLAALETGEQRLLPSLTAMSIDDLARPLPDERNRDVLPTIGHAVVHVLAAHTAYHVGQLMVWRRAAGLASPPRAV